MEVKKPECPLCFLAKKWIKGRSLPRKNSVSSGNETKQHLADTLLQGGSRLLIDCLEAILSGHQGIEPLPQGDSDATYTQKIKKEDGIINWDKTAETIEKEIRAVAGWPKSRTRLGTIDSIITEARGIRRLWESGRL